MKKINNILIVSGFSTNPNVYTYASSFERIFKKLGYTVTTFNSRKVVLPYVTRIYQELHPYTQIINNYILNKQLIKQACSTQQPDLIFFVKAETITHHTLATLKKKTNALLVNFYPDSPFTFWNGNSNKYILNSLPLYDLFLIWSKMLIPPLQSAGCKRVEYFPFAYDQEIFKSPTHISKTDKEKYKADVSFVGTWTQERENWLTQLIEARPNLGLAIWGNGWKTKLAPLSILCNMIRGDAIYPPESNKIFHLSTINLNFIRLQNMTSHNMRTFEVPASKGFLLTQRTHEQAQELFTENESIVCFDSVEELIKKIDFCLNETSIRNAIIVKAYKQSETFNLENYLQDFIKIIDKIKNEKG